jgi:fibronectin-binding autotransporter adhesin
VPRSAALAQTERNQRALQTLYYPEALGFLAESFKSSLSSVLGKRRLRLGVRESDGFGGEACLTKTEQAHHNTPTTSTYCREDDSPEARRFGRHGLLEDLESEAEMQDRESKNRGNVTKNVRTRRRRTAMLAHAAMVALPAAGLAVREASAAISTITWSNSASNNNFFTSTYSPSGSPTASTIVVVPSDSNQLTGGTMNYMNTKGTTTTWSVAAIEYVDNSTPSNDISINFTNNNTNAIIVTFDGGGSITSGPTTYNNIILANTTTNSTTLLFSNTSGKGATSVVLSGGTNGAANTNVAYVASGDTIDLENSISGTSQSLSLAGPGTLVLGGTNTYSGGTTVSSGTLIINGGTSGTGTYSPTGLTTGGGAAGTVTLAGGTLSSKTASSYIAGTVSLAASTTNIIAAGAGASGTGTGTLSIGGNLVFGSGSTDTLDFNISGSANSLLNVAGSISFNGVTPTVALPTYQPTVGTSTPYILLADAAGGLTTTEFNLPTVSFFNWAISSNGQDLELVSATGPAVTWAPSGGSNAASGTWNTVAANWVPTGGTGATTYADTDVVTFGDINGALIGTVNIPNNVAPAIVNFGNTGTGSATNTTAYTLTGAGAITGSGTAVNITFGGLVVFGNSSNSYTGVTTISPGTLRAGAANVFSPNSVVTLSNAANALLDLAGFNQTISNLSGGGSTGGNVALGGGTLTVGDSSNQTFSGVIGDVVTGGIVTSPAQGGSLIKTGSGNLFLGATETYGGSTTVSAGKLELVAGAGLLPSTTVLTINGAEFDLNGNSQTVAGLSGNSTAVLSINTGGPNFTVNQSINTTFAGVISASGILNKTGSGSLTLSGANSYTGGTNVSAGTLVAADTSTAASQSSTGTKPVTIAAGTLASASGVTSYVAGAVSSLGSGTIAPGGVGTIGTLDLLSTLSLKTGDTLNFDVSGTSYDQLNITGAISEAGSPSLTLGSGNTYTRGMTYTLATFASSPNLGFTDTNPAGFSWNITNTQIQLVSVVATDTWTGATSAHWNTSDANWNTTAPGTLYVEGDAVVFGDGASNTSITVDAVGANGGVSPKSVLFTALNTNYSFSGGPIGGVGAVTLAGSANVTFTSSNSYTGGTTISGGMLTISNDNQTGTGNITLAGGTLQSAGAVTSTKNLLLTASTSSIFDTDGNSSTYNAITGAGNLEVMDSTGNGGNLTSTAAVGQVSGTAGTLKIDPNANFTIAGSTNSTFYGSITNNGNLNISGGGKITFDGISLSGNGNIQVQGTAGATIESDNGSLAAGQSTTISNNIVFNVPGNIGATSGNSLTLTGSISGANGVTFETSANSGAGLVVLQATSGYSGSTLINNSSNGIVRLGISNALPIGTALTFGSGSASVGSLDLAGYNQQLASLASNTTNSNAGGVTNAGSSTSIFTLSGTAITTFAGVIGTSSAVTGSTNNIALVLPSTNTGTLVLTGGSTYTGGTTISGGTIEVGASNALPKAGAVTLASTSGVLLDLDGNNQTVSELNGGGSGANVALGKGIFVVGDATNQEFDGIIEDSGGASNTTGGSLVKVGAGTLYLTAVNTYTGGTTVSTGTLKINSASSLGASGGVATIKSNGTLEAAANINTSRNFVVTGSNATIQVDPTFTYDITGSIGSTGSLTKTGLGTLQLQGALSYSGGTTNVNGGTLLLGSSNQLPAGAVALANASGALLDFDATSQAVTELSGGGSTAGNVSLGGGTLTLGDGTTNNSTFGGVIEDAGGAAGNNVTGGSLIKTGTSTETLAAVESYTGPTTISGGTLALQDISLGTTAALPASTILTVTNGGTFQTNGQAQTIAELSDGGTAGGTVSINKSSNGTTFASLTVGDANNTTFAGVISASGSLIKANSGSLTLSGVNTYTGSTTVSGGSLLLSTSTTNNIAKSTTITVGTTASSAAVLDVTGVTGTGGFALASGQTLRGTGTVNGTLTVASGSTITAGPDGLTPGALSTGAQVWSGGGAYTWKLKNLGAAGANPMTGDSGTNGSGQNSSGGTAGSDWDLVTMSTLDISNAGVTSAFTLSPTGTVSTAPYAQYSWIIAQATGSATAINLPAGMTQGENLLANKPSGGAANAFILTTNGFTDSGGLGTFTLEAVTIGSNDDLVLDYNAAPEPGTALMVLGGIAPMLLARRRRKAAAVKN